MTGDAKPEPEEPECGFGRCVPAHPLHCCHTAYGTKTPAGPRNLVLCGWRCGFCGKESRAHVLIKLR